MSDSDILWYALIIFFLLLMGVRELVPRKLKFPGLHGETHYRGNIWEGVTLISLGLGIAVTVVVKLW